MNKLNIDVKQFHFNKVAPANVNEDKLVVEKHRIDTPVGITTYYHEFIKKWTINKNTADAKLDKFEDSLSNLKIRLSFDIDYFEDEGIVLKDYEEYNRNLYINGKLQRKVYELLGTDNIDESNVNLIRYVETLKAIHTCKKEIDRCNKMLALKSRQFTKIARMFYNEVHKALIINGYGYVFEGHIGWTCINRVSRSENKNRLTHIDFRKTEERKKEILARGGKLWNKEEAEWCKERGIEYKGEDYRVFADPEYFYEYPLIDCNLKDYTNIKYAPSDFRGAALRGKSNKDLAIESGNDIKKVCDLPLDYRTKLSICLDIDKLLYTNFVRNETQKAVYR